MSVSPNLQLPYLDPNQNQKSVTHNAALRRLDALVQVGVQASSLQAPPAAPADGQRWIVAPGATGAWAGQDHALAAWQDGAWSFYAPGPGTLAYDVAGAALLCWTGTRWITVQAAAPAPARTAVADAAYAAQPADRLVAYTALTAPRTVTLPAAAAVPAGTVLTVVDESGQCSSLAALTLAAAGADTIDGAPAAVIALPYGYFALESDGAARWSLVDQAPGMAPLATLAQGPAGAALQFGVLEGLVTLAGASTAAPVAIPARAIVFAVTSRTVAAVAGASSYGVGVAGNPTQFGGQLGAAAGSTNAGVIGPTAFYSPTPVLVTATDGAFTAGAVRIAIHYALCGVPAA